MNLANGLACHEFPTKGSSPVAKSIRRLYWRLCVQKSSVAQIFFSFSQHIPTKPFWLWPVCSSVIGLKDNNKLVHVHYKQRASHNHVRDLQHCKTVRSFCVGQHLVVRMCAVRALYQLRLGITPLASAAVGDYSPSPAQARPHKLQSFNFFKNQGRLSVCLSVCLSGKSRSVWESTLAAIRTSTVRAFSDSRLLWEFEREKLLFAV